MKDILIENRVDLRITPAVMTLSGSNEIKFEIVSDMYALHPTMVAIVEINNIITDLIEIKSVHKTHQCDLLSQFHKCRNDIARNTRRGVGNFIWMNKSTFNSVELEPISKIINYEDMVMEDYIPHNLLIINYIGNSIVDKALAYDGDYHYNPNFLHHQWYDYFEIIEIID